MQVVDSFGNVVTGDSSSVTLSISTNPGGGTLHSNGGSVSIESIPVISGGSGYSTAPTVIIAPPIAPGGVQATATATVVGGSVVSISITNPGSGYTTTPVVSLSGGGFTSAATLGVPTLKVTQTAVNGVVTFDSLSIDKASPGYRLPPPTGFSPAATSSTFTITVGTAHHLVFLSRRPTPRPARSSARRSRSRWSTSTATLLTITPTSPS